MVVQQKLRGEYIQHLYNRTLSIVPQCGTNISRKTSSVWKNLESSTLDFLQEEPRFILMVKIIIMMKQ